MAPSKTKVIAVGLPRCGGQSLAYALSYLLDGTCVHSPGLDEALIDEHDAAVEVFLPVTYIRRRWPNARIIYNERSMDSWFESCQRVMKINDVSTWNHPMWRYPAGAFRDYRCHYEATVLSVPDWCSVMGGDWTSLCRTLKCEVPTIPFPRRDRFGQSAVRIADTR